MLLVGFFLVIMPEPLPRPWPACGREWVGWCDEEYRVTNFLGTKYGSVFSAPVGSSLINGKDMCALHLLFFVLLLSVCVKLFPGSPSNWEEGAGLKSQGTCLAQAREAKLCHHPVLG